MGDIRYYRKEVYGKTLFYVKNRSQRKALRALTGKKTISEKDFEALKMLGFEVAQARVS